MALKRWIDSDPSNGFTYYYVSGSKGAVQFAILTIKALDRQHGIDLGFHSRTEIEGATGMGNCPVLDGADCWYDGSGLNGQRLFEKFKKHEDPEALWRELEVYYDQVFGE